MKNTNIRFFCCWWIRTQDLICRKFNIHGLIILIKSLIIKLTLTSKCKSDICINPIIGISDLVRLSNWTSSTSYLFSFFLMLQKLKCDIILGFIMVISLLTYQILIWQNSNLFPFIYVCTCSIYNNVYEIFEFKQRLNYQKKQKSKKFRTQAKSCKLFRIQEYVNNFRSNFKGAYGR